MEKNDVYDQKINRRTVFRSSERCSVLSNETTTHGTTHTLYCSTHPLQNENEISSERRRYEQKTLTFLNKGWPKILFLSLSNGVMCFQVKLGLTYARSRHNYLVLTHDPHKPKMMCPRAPQARAEKKSTFLTAKVRKVH